MQVQELYIYPVKSLSGIAVNEAEALERGFRFDRRWMLVDLDNKFISQRTEHRLSLLKAEISTSEINISEKWGGGSLNIPLSASSEKRLLVSVWDDQTVALHYSEEADKWFSDFLGTRCKLVYLPEYASRPVDPRYAVKQENVSFADAFPYLLISQASLDALNARLKTPVPMNRFRPNLVVSGCKAFAEDAWAEIQIGEVRFKVAKPCARCVLTTVDQETGVKGKEPLATLAKFRTANQKVLFGQNLIALNEGIIKAGDEVKVLQYRQAD